MTIYYSASKNAFYSSDVTDVASMPSDRVALTDTEYADIMAKQEAGYRITANTSTGKPQAVAQSLADATRTTDALDSEVVHLAGTETITGTKTFTSDILTQHSITNAKGKSSVDEFHSAMIFRDTQGQAFGHLQTASYADTGDILVKLSAVTGLRKTTPDETTHYIGMGMKLDGTPYTTAPTPPAGDSSTQIATTEWVQANVSSEDVNAVHKTGDETVAGTKIFTGAIKAGVDALVSHSDDASVVRVDGGSGWDKGATLLLYGKDEASYKGMAKIRVTDGTNTNELILKPDGTASWKGQNLMMASGARGKIAGYETNGTNTTINASAPDSNQTGSNITVSNGTAGTSWTKIVRVTAAVTVTLGTSWVWQGGSAPTIAAGGVLVCCWCGSGGIASFVSP